VTRSLLEDIKTKQLQWYGHVQKMEEGGTAKIRYWNGGHQGEGNEADPNLPGRRGLGELREKRD
jgi:hypothetical protein